MVVTYKPFLLASYDSVVRVTIVHVVSPFVKYLLSVVTVRVTLQDVINRQKPVTANPATITPIRARTNGCNIVIYVLVRQFTGELSQDLSRDRNVRRI